MRLEPHKRAPNTLCPIYFANKIGDKAFDFTVIEYHAIGFIANETSLSVKPKLCDQIRRDVDHVRLQAEGLIHFEINLIPAENLIRRYLKCLADGFVIPQQTYQPFGKIRIPGQHPK